MCCSLQLYIFILVGTFFGLGMYYISIGCVSNMCMNYEQYNAKFINTIKYNDNDYMKFIIDEDEQKYCLINDNNNLVSSTLHINKTYDVYIKKTNDKCIIDRNNELIMLSIVGICLILVGHTICVLFLCAYFNVKPNKVINEEISETIHISNVYIV